MDPFSEAVADYCDNRDCTVVFRRSQASGEWEAAIILKDYYGRFEAVVRHQEPKRKEPPDAFTERVRKMISTALVASRKSRIGITASTGADADTRISA